MSSPWLLSSRTSGGTAQWCLIISDTICAPVTTERTSDDQGQAFKYSSMLETRLGTLFHNHSQAISDLHSVNSPVHETKC